MGITGRNGVEGAEAEHLHQEPEQDQLAARLFDRLQDQEEPDHVEDRPHRPGQREGNVMLGDEPGFLEDEQGADQAAHEEHPVDLRVKEQLVAPEGEGRRILEQLGVGVELLPVEGVEEDALEGLEAHSKGVLAVTVDEVGGGNQQHPQADQ